MQNTWLKALLTKGKKAIKSASRRLPEFCLIAVFLLLTFGSLALQLLQGRFSFPPYSLALNAAISVGSGGLTSLIFYYVLTERLERRRHRILREGLMSTYSEAKRNIAYAVVHASQKGGRKDIQADFDTINSVLTVSGFREIFESGGQADEGFYAFQNQMSDPTPEYDEIIFNLKIVSRSLDRIVDNSRIDDVWTYKFFSRTCALIARIERNGAGYDESKPLCSLIWEMFAGWNFVDGKLGYDPIERAIARL